MNDLLYKVQYEDGRTCITHRREEALLLYAENNGTRLESKTKDLFPWVHLIFDGSGYDPFNLTKEDTMKSTTKAERKAISKYDQANTTQVKLKLNTETDMDILEYLERCGNKQGLIKELIRERIAEEKQKA